MTEQQYEVAVGPDAAQVTSAEPDDVVVALDNLLIGCLADGGDRVLDHVDLIAEVVEAARNRIVELTTRTVPAVAIPAAVTLDSGLHLCVRDLRVAAERFVEDRLEELDVSGFVRVVGDDSDLECGANSRAVRFSIEVPHSFGQDRDAMIETVRREVAESGLKIEDDLTVKGVRLGGTEVADSLWGMAVVEPADLGRSCRHFYCATQDAGTPLARPGGSGRVSSFDPTPPGPRWPDHFRSATK